MGREIRRGRRVLTMREHEEEQRVEVKFFVGEWVSTREFADRLEQAQDASPTTPADEDEVEFVQPKVPGRHERRGADPDDAA